jgi:hypothetical protein
VPTAIAAATASRVQHICIWMPHVCEVRFCLLSMHACQNTTDVEPSDAGLLVNDEMFAP